MAQPTQLVYTDNPGELPASYQIPAGLDLVLQSVVARFDGAAAAGPFLATLSIYSQDGKLISRVRPDQVFAAGDTGVVTYAPFLRRAPAPVSAGLPSAWMERTTNLTLTSGAPTVLTSYNSGAATSPFTVDLANGILRIAATGVYLVAAGHLYTTDFTGDVSCRLRTYDQTQKSWQLTAAHWHPKFDDLFGAAMVTVEMFVSALGAPDNGWDAVAYQASGVDRTLDTAWLHATRLGDYPT